MRQGYPQRKSYHHYFLVYEVFQQIPTGSLPNKYLVYFTLASSSSVHCPNALISVWYFPKDIFTRATFPVRISQASTSQSEIFQTADSQRLGGLRGLRDVTRMVKGDQRCGYYRIRGRALRLRQTKEVAAWEIAHLGSCMLGKTPGEVAARKNALPNILLSVFPSSTLINIAITLKFLDFLFSRSNVVFFFTKKKLSYKLIS